MKIKPLPEVKASQLADLFSTLSDPNRVRLIALLLENECSVSILAQQLHMSPSAVSHQLRGLRQMRLVRSRRQGRHVFYSLDDTHVEQLLRMGVDHVDHGRP